MSKETEPTLSRRQLREKSAQTTGAPDKSAAPAGVAPVSPAPDAPVPADPVSEAPASAAPALEAPASELPGKTPPAADAALPRERESQIRARDRAALRAFKELADSPAQDPLPSRKALRQAQLDAERAPITALNPVVSVRATAANVATSTPTNPPTQPSPSVASPTDAAAVDGVSLTSAAPASVQAPRTRGGRRAAAVANDKYAVPARSTTGEGENQHPDDAEAQTVAPAAVNVPSPPTTKPGSRLVSSVSPEVAALTVPEAATVDAAADAAQAPGADSSTTGGQGAAESSAHVPPLPALVPGGDYYPISAGPPVPPSTQDLQLLAAEKAEAERTAILAQRAQARERLAQENAKNRRPAADPTATNNLAMVTPMEFIDVPGVERPVMRPPTTTHVPIVTRSTPRQAPARPKGPVPDKGKAAGTSARPADSGQGAPQRGEAGASVHNVSAERFDAALAARAAHRPGPGNRPLTGGRSSTLKRAEAMAAVDHGASVAVPSPVPAARPSAQPVREAAAAAPVQRSQMPPMPADYAHGLEPLDAMTAGLGRTQRNFLIQWGSIVLGGAAFVAGVIMVLTNILN